MQRIYRHGRSARLAPYQHALDRIDAFLARTNPELERQKLEEAMLLLFGPEPDGWISPSEEEEGSYEV